MSDVKFGDTERIYVVETEASNGVEHIVCRAATPEEVSVVEVEENVEYCIGNRQFKSASEIHDYLKKLHS